MSLTPRCYYVHTQERSRYINNTLRRVVQHKNNESVVQNNKTNTTAVAPIPDAREKESDAAHNKTSADKQEMSTVVS